jgi:hypothetical protein
MNKPKISTIDYAASRRHFLTTLLMLPLLALAPRSRTPATAVAVLSRERPLRSLTAAELRRPHELAG